MEVFERKEVKDNETSYIVNTHYLEDLGEDERKDCTTVMYLFELMKKYPEKSDELNEILIDINRLKDNCFENAEDLLKLYGMDEILSKIFDILEN